MPPRPGCVFCGGFRGEVNLPRGVSRRAVVLSYQWIRHRPSRRPRTANGLPSAWECCLRREWRVSRGTAASGRSQRPAAVNRNVRNSHLGLVVRSTLQWRGRGESRRCGFETGPRCRGEWPPAIEVVRVSGQWGIRGVQRGNLPPGAGHRCFRHPSPVRNVVRTWGPIGFCVWKNHRVHPRKDSTRWYGHRGIRGCKGNRSTQSSWL